MSNSWQARKWLGLGVQVATSMLLLSPAAAQSASERPKQPSVGIALEGGGALGLAHIGVLRWMEEHRVPVHYMAGTSMGGLVGGMYSTGMSPAELEKMVLGINWERVLGEQISYRDLIYRRKQDRRDFQNGLEFGLKGGFSVPGGLNSGQEITLLLDRHALPYSGLKSFNELPIPFRCVAADLNTGKAHVFAEGPLGEALRATMSLPAVFTPVSLGDNFYVDGGLLNNLPVDVVKEMGAGVVIAIYLDAPTAEQATHSMFSVMGRSISVMIAANERRNMELADLLVPVDLKGFTSSEYTRGPEIIKKGYEAAEKKAAVLSKFALSEGDWQDHIKLRYARKRAAPQTTAAVQVAGLNGELKTDLEAVLKNHSGKELNVDELEREIHLISGVGRFSRFNYHVADIGGKQTLVVTAEERGYAPPFINIGLSIDGSDFRNVRFSMAGRVTALDFGGYRSELRTDFSLGSIWMAGVEYYKPFSPASRWFYAPRVFAVNNPFDLYDKSDRIATYRMQRYGGGLDAGYAINRFSEIRAGYEAGYFSSDIDIGANVLPTPSGRTGSTVIRYELDTRDKPVVPRSGQSVRFQTRWYDAMPGASEGFPLSEVQLGFFKPVSTPGTVYLQASGGSTFGHDDTGLPQFFLGGPGRLNAYGMNEARGNQYFLGRLGYLHEVFSLPPLIGTKVYLTGAYELGKVYGARVDSRLPMDGAVGLVMETVLGPIGIGGAVGDRGHRKWYFQVGRIF